MNERIKELWSQTVRNYGHSGQEICAQQFAELIVQECAAHLHRRGIQGFGILEERNLKEHFGFE